MQEENTNVNLESENSKVNGDGNFVSGEVLVGTVTELLPNEVKVDIGRKYGGVVPLTELTTDLSQKLSRKNIVPSGTYADYLNLHWFSAQLPFDNNIKVFVDLTYIINCYGKLALVHSADAFKDLKMKIELRFVFPKKTSFEKFEYIGANYILDWKETSNEYSLSVKTVEDCKVEFYF